MDNLPHELVFIISEYALPKEKMDQTMRELRAERVLQENIAYYSLEEEMNNNLLPCLINVPPLPLVHRTGFVDLFNERWRRIKQHTQKHKVYYV